MPSGGRNIYAEVPRKGACSAHVLAEGTKPPSLLGRMAGPLEGMLVWSQKHGGFSQRTAKEAPGSAAATVVIQGVNQWTEEGLSLCNSAFLIN